MFAINHAALLSETAPPAQKDADAGQDLELEELGLASPGSMPHQSDASPAWEDFTQRLQEEKTDDTATSPGVSLVSVTRDCLSCFDWQDPLQLTLATVCLLSKSLC